MAHPLIILVLIGMVFKIISEIFLGMLCLIRVLPLLLLNFESTSREEPLNISLGESSRSIFIQLRGFYVFELIPLLIKITSNLDDSSTSLPSFPYDLNLKLLDIITIPNMVQKVLTASYLVVFVFH